jgi:serine/threonine-protein kinase RsbW
MPHILRLPAELKNLAVIRQFLEEAGRQLQSSDRALDDLTLAVDEMATNIILHGYGDQPGEIELEVTREAAALVVYLRDQAPVFDPTSLPDPDITLPLDQRPIGGLGVFLARKRVDSLKHRPQARGGNELIFTKQIG